MLFAAEGVDGGFGCAFGPEVLHEDGDVIVKTLKFLTLNGGDALGDIAAVSLGFGRFTGNTLYKRQL